MVELMSVYSVVHSSAREGRCRMRVVQYHLDDDDQDELVRHQRDGDELQEVMVHSYCCSLHLMTEGTVMTIVH